MRRRSLARQLVFGAIVALLVIAAVPVVYFAGRDGVDAVRDVDPSTALERGLVAVAAALVPVIAMAAYAHWLNVSSRSREPHESHVPSRAERVLVGVAVIMVVVAAWPIVTFSYRGSVDGFEARELAFGVGYGLLGVAYVAFTAFCLKRYAQWIR